MSERRIAEVAEELAGLLGDDWPGLYGASGTAGTDEIGSRSAGLHQQAWRQANEILAALLDVPRYWPSQHGNEVLDVEAYTVAVTAVERLKRGAPFAYAVGRASFRHLTLDVDERVLIPRPETELLVDEVLRMTSGGAGVAVDIGTGSGAIALSLASEGAFGRVIATDVSPDALAVARNNAAAVTRALRVPVEFREGSLLEPVMDVRADVIVSNPPYISLAERAELPASVREWEPALALFSDDDGMAATRSIVRGAAALLAPNGVLALEVDARRASLVAEQVAVDARYYDVAVRLDLTGRERFVVARRTI